MTLDQPHPLCATSRTSICKTSPGSRAIDKNGPGERVDAVAIDGQEFGDRHARMHLRTAGIETFQLHGVTRRDCEPRCRCAIPAGMGRLGGKRVSAIAAQFSDLDGHLQLDKRVARQRGNSDRRAHVAAASPKSSTSRSEAPLITLGESAKPGTAFT